MVAKQRARANEATSYDDFDRVNIFEIEVRAQESDFSAFVVKRQDILSSIG